MRHAFCLIIAEFLALDRSMYSGVNYGSVSYFCLLTDINVQQQTFLRHISSSLLRTVRKHRQTIYLQFQAIISNCRQHLPAANVHDAVTHLHHDIIPQLQVACADSDPKPNPKPTLSLIPEAQEQQVQWVIENISDDYSYDETIAVITTTTIETGLKSEISTLQSDLPQSDGDSDISQQENAAIQRTGVGVGWCGLSMIGVIIFWN